MGWIIQDEDGEETGWHPPTQDQVAEAFASTQAGRLRYCHDGKAWFQWDGVAWRRDETGEVAHLIRATAREMATDPWGKPGVTAGGTRFVAGVERFARADPALAVTARAWNADPMRLGTPAGPVDLSTGRLLPADPADGISLTTAVAPAEETPSGSADCPLWLRFLDETFGADVELIAYLQRYLGYALTGSVAEHVLLFGWGSGGNGKSVFLNTILAVMGDYARPAALATLTGADLGRHGAKLDALRGARLAAVAESDGDIVWSERRLKLLTGGDPVVGQRGSFTPTCKLLVMANAPPSLGPLDVAMRRRLRIVAFRHCPRTPDRGLEAKLRGETPAILRWMIDGCLAWRAQGLSRPASAIVEATSDYIFDEDTLGRFLGACCDVDLDDPTCSTSAADLYDAWTHWAAKVGVTVGSRRAFGLALTVRGFGRERTTFHRGYIGLRLRAGRDPMTDMTL